MGNVQLDWVIAMIVTLRGSFYSEIEICLKKCIALKWSRHNFEVILRLLYFYDLFFFRKSCNCGWSYFLFYVRFFEIDSVFTKIFWNYFVIRHFSSSIILPIPGVHFFFIIRFYFFSIDGEYAQTYSEIVLFLRIFPIPNFLKSFWKFPVGTLFFIIC
jgi:hypothetical protein